MVSTKLNITASGLQRRAQSGFRWILSLPPTFPYALALAGTFAFVLLWGVTAFWPSDTAFGYAAWAADDFFYYAEIAQNIATTGRSTYDGVTLTDGYHPLWMAVCTALAALFGIQAAAFFVSVFIIQSALVLVGVWAFVRLLRAPLVRSVLSPHCVAPAALLYGVSGVMIGVTGMEIALLWPLLPLFCFTLLKLAETPSLMQAIAATGLATLCTLSRLDSAIVLFPLALGALWTVAGKIGARGMLAMWPASLGFLPVGVYLASNELIFGSVMPLSGAAKRLALEDAPGGLSMNSLSSFVEIYNQNYLIVPVAVTLLGISAALLVLAVQGLRSSVAGKGFLLLAIGVFAFHMLTALQSDWSLWLWYFYGVSFVGSLGAALLISQSARLPGLRRIEGFAALGLSAFVVLFALGANAWMLRSPPSVSNPLFLRAIPVMEFAARNPGTYAMGDGAGAVGFMLDAPLVQLEGLVNDANMLDDISKQRTIFESLQRQGVDFYVYGDEKGEVSTNAIGCPELVEPLQGGPRSPKMKQMICEPPVVDTETLWLRTRIWDVRDGLD